tara:strand:+ start:131 stop:889 length:759 start_codon:yes stop_codon:yes gene_type:complete
MRAPDIEAVYAIVGDSPSPLLVLIETLNAESYVLIHTEDKDISYLQSFLEGKYSDICFRFEKIPLIGLPSEQVKAISEIFSDVDDTKVNSSATFVTAGTTTMAMALFHHVQAKYNISLRRGPKVQISSREDENRLLSIDLEDGKITLDDILASKGWSFNPDILELTDHNGTSRILGIDAEIHEGYLVFTAKTSSDSERKKKSEYNEEMISKMNSLIDEFGINGAKYRIHGELGKRSLNLLHDRILHIQEEEK